MNVKFKEYDCNLVFTTYNHLGNTAIMLVDSKSGEPVATATLNPEMVLPKNQVVIKDYSENYGMFQTLFEHGIISGPYHWYESGFIKAPVCELLVDVLQDDEEEDDTPYSGQIFVKWVVKTDEFKTFEFGTEKDLYIDEAEMEHDLFRLVIWNEGHAGFDEKTQEPTKIEILVANREDYDIHEDVTYLFDVDVIVAECLAAEPEIADMTTLYNLHYQERREAGEDV